MLANNHTPNLAIATDSSRHLDSRICSVLVHVNDDTLQILLEILNSARGMHTDMYIALHRMT